jgi:hypothetical protein
MIELGRFVLAVSPGDQVLTAPGNRRRYFL